MRSMLLRSGLLLMICIVDMTSGHTRFLRDGLMRWLIIEVVFLFSGESDLRLDY